MDNGRYSLKTGDVLRIGMGEFVVIATKEETGQDILIRNLKSKVALYLPHNISFKVVRTDEIIYLTDTVKEVRKKKKEALDSVHLLTELLIKADAEFHDVVEKAKEIESGYRDDYER